MNEPVTAIGLMSGTSLDGIDIAVVKTDGDKIVKPLYAKTQPYESGVRDLLHQCLGLRDEADPRMQEATGLLTRVHAQACAEALEIFPDTKVIGFHGQTIWHAPEEGMTRQLGDGALLADLTRTPVVFNFRQGDMAQGGQGAPLMPLYHAAVVRTLPRPLAVLNIGGVANVTWIGEDEGQILAFDTGPGNALVNDWMEKHTGAVMDRDGQAAQKGRADMEWIKKYLHKSYFLRPPPKSLDRQDFELAAMAADWSLEDGAATLATFTAACVGAGQKFFPKAPRMWIVTGGGRLNLYMMDQLKALLSSQVVTAEAVGWNGDALEAEGFAYLAVRSMYKLPLTVPQTTGCRQAAFGGTLVRPNLAARA